jgi:hypothetical protein
MKKRTTQVKHQRETKFLGELQTFSGLALSPNDPAIEPRSRKGRPVARKRPSTKKKGSEDRG